jgi:hypothetical protein
LYLFLVSSSCDTCLTHLILLDLVKTWSSPTTQIWRRRGERMYSSYSFTT